MYRLPLLILIFLNLIIVFYGEINVAALIMLVVGGRHIMPRLILHLLNVQSQLVVIGTFITGEILMSIFLSLFVNGRINVEFVE